VRQERNIFNYVAVIDIHFVCASYLICISRQQQRFSESSSSRMGESNRATSYGLRWINIKRIWSLSFLFDGNLISKWSIFPQSVGKWKLINYFITFHPSPARISLKAASITVTLRNWSSFEYHISGRLISLPIAFNENHPGECVGAKCKKLTIDSIDFICLHSRNILVFISIECGGKKTLLNTGDLTERERREKKTGFLAELRWWNSEEISF
jgi:hypothetical protein